MYHQLMQEKIVSFGERLKQERLARGWTQQSLANHLSICVDTLRYAEQGKRSNAVIKELEANYARKEASGQDVAGVYAGLGEKDKAHDLAFLSMTATRSVNSCRLRAASNSARWIASAVA